MDSIINKITFTERPSFTGYKSELDHAKYVIFGAPHDMTTCYRPGTRFGPPAIREASLNIETYSYFSQRDMSEVRIHDLGDIFHTGNHRDRLNQIELVLKQITGLWGKVPIMLGGEHSITIPVREVFNKDVLFIIFDAHGDLREQYLDEPYSHASMTKRLLDRVNPEQILQVGIRAQSLEEIEFVRENPELIQLSSLDIHKKGFDWAIKKFKDKIQQFNKIYISVDIDGYDPSFAPGTGTPEAMGLNPCFVFSLLHEIKNEQIIGMDLNEVNPTYDHAGITSVLAAKTLYEILLTK
jgi:agmatinase